MVSKMDYKTEKSGIYRTCYFCEEQIGLTDNVVRVPKYKEEEEKKIDREKYVHEKCYLKNMIEMKEKKIERLKKQRNDPLYLNFTKLSRTVALHKSNGKEESRMIVSKEMHDKMLEENEEIIIKMVDNKKIHSCRGMRVEVDENITGWYIEDRGVSKWES